MTITIGYWAIPLIFTLLNLGIAIFWPLEDHSGGFIDLSGFVILLRLGLAVIVSLIAWLIYFIVT